MNKVAIFDGTYMAFRAIFASLDNPILSDKYIKYLIMRMIIKTLREINGAYPIIAFDYGGSNYRKSIYPLYKANRVEEGGEPIQIFLPDGKYKGLEISDRSVPASVLIPIKSFFEGPEKEYIYGQIRIKMYTSVRNWIIKNLPNIGIQTAMIKGYEGDDWAALFSGYTDHSGYVVSDDSDWRLYLSDKWVNYKPLKEKMVTLNDLRTELNNYLEDSISPTHMLQSILALTGTHNNVIGFKGIGEVNGGKISNLLLTGKPLSESNKKQKSVLEDIDKYNLNMKVIGSDFLTDCKGEMFNHLVESYDLVKPIDQIAYMDVISELESENLDNMFFDFNTYISKMSKEELVSNFK